MELTDKQIYKNMRKTLGDQSPSISTVKNRFLSLRSVKFSIEDEGQSG